MYKVDSITPAGGDWWHIRLSGPKGTSIPYRQKHPGITEDELFQRAFDKCFVLNVKSGYVHAKEKQYLYRKSYRAWAAMRAEERKREGNI